MQDIHSLSSQSERAKNTIHYILNANIRKGKFSRTGRESPWDTTLNEPVPRLIRMLVCDCDFVPNQEPVLCCLRDLLIRKSLLANSTVSSTPLKKSVCQSVSLQ